MNSVRKNFGKAFNRFKSRLFLSVFLLPIIIEVLLYRQVEEVFIVTAVAAWLTFIVLSLLFGRIYCGVICEAGAIQRLFNLIGEGIIGKNFEIPKRIDKYLRWFKYLFAIVLILWGISKMKILVSNGMPLHQYSYIASSLGWGEENILELLSVFFITTTVIGTILIKSFWCKYLCFKGAVVGGVSRIGLSKIKVEKSSCNNCGICTKVCPVNIEVNKEIEKRPLDCLSCQQCVAVCPKKAIYNEALGKRLNPFLFIIAATMVYILIIIISTFISRFIPIT